MASWVRCGERGRRPGLSYEDFCPYFQEAIELLGRRWAGAIARALLAGPLRFSQLARMIPNITDAALAQRLKELEAEDIVIRKVDPTPPVRVTYLLTAKGRALEKVVEEIEAWADVWIKRRRNEHGRRAVEGVGEFAR
jgi:DNA-binding HxlR family transcriptional regulator